MYYSYILKSLKDRTYYYGSTKDLEQRLKLHNSGKVKYTKARRPYRIHFSEGFETRKEALLKEKFYKSIDGYKWLKSEGIT